MGGASRWLCLGLTPNAAWFSQFSLVQFSDRFQEHFTFKDFATSSDPLNLLNSVWQLGGWTFTASAIRFVT